MSFETTTNAQLLAMWRPFLSARGIQQKQIVRHFRAIESIAQKYDLRNLTANNAVEWLITLSNNCPVKYFSDHVIAAMNGEKLTRAEIISRLEKIGIAVDRKKLFVALHNRALFEFTPNKSHRDGTYRARRGLRKIKPRTLNMYLLSAKMFYEWAIENGYISENPFAKIRRIREEISAEIVYLTHEERDQMLALNPPLTVWIALFAGLQRGEIKRLQWDDLDLNNGQWQAFVGQRKASIRGTVVDRLYYL